MACDTQYLGRLAIAVGAGAPSPDSATPDANSPALFLSNAPEQIGPGMQGSWTFGAGPKNLCRATVSGLDVPSKVRVYLWHISRFNQDTNWAVIVGSQQTTGSVTNLKSQVANSSIIYTDFVEIGNCLADSHLLGTLDPQTPSQTYNLATDQVIWSKTIPAGTQNENSFRIVAAVLEFDVQVNEVFTIRSAVSLDGNFGTYDSPLANNQNNWSGKNPPEFATHARGYWKHSGITMNIPGVYDCTLVQAPPKFKEWQICDDNGPEAYYFSVVNSLAEQLQPIPPSTVPIERPNKGAYGANLKYIAQYHNSSPLNSARVYVGLRARGIPGKFYGVQKVRTLVPTPIVSSTPTRLFAIPDTDFPDQAGYNFTDTYPAGIYQSYISVGPNGSGTIEVSIGVAGGAGTPANLILSREMVWSTPVVGGPD